MKKILSIILVLALSLSVLSGCGKTTSDDAYSNKEEVKDTLAEVKEEVKEDLVVGFIYIGPVGDGGYTFAHDQGRLYLEENSKELGVKTLYKESVPESQEVESEIRNMIDSGAEVIFATSFGYMPFVENMSKEYPDVKFLHCSGYTQNENMTNYFGRMYEARYLSGIVAAMKTKSNVLGYVGAFPIPEVIRGINAFTLGAQSVNADVTVKVRWTSTWYDPATEKEAANSLLDEGADIIAQHQDTAGPQQAAEEKGAFSIGYNSDMKDLAPKAYMTAPVWNWGPYYLEQVKAVIDGTWKSESYWGGMNEDVVKLAPLTDLAPEGAQEAIDEAANKIMDGTLNVFAGPIKDQDGNVKVEAGSVLTDSEMLSMKWFVEGVEGKLE